MTKDIRDSSDTELEITRIHDMGEDDTAIEVKDCSTTERIGRKLARHPIWSVVISSLIIGTILWSSSNYWGLLINDNVQNKEIEVIKKNVEEIKIHVKEEVEELSNTCKAMNEEQQEQRILLVELKTLVEGLKRE